MLVKKKRLKARDIIAWEEPLLGERLKRPGNRIQTAQIRVSFGRPEGTKAFPVGISSRSSAVGLRCSWWGSILWWGEAPETVLGFKF